MTSDYINTFFSMSKTSTLNHEKKNLRSLAGSGSLTGLIPTAWTASMGQKDQKSGNHRLILLASVQSKVSPGVNDSHGDR